jgi:hypothetical protein
LQLIPALDHILCIVPKDSAGSGQCDTAVVPDEELFVQFGFQPLDGPGQTRWCDVAGLAGPAEMQGVGQML